MPKVLTAALLGGLIAGGAVGVFHFLLTEPLIDKAIAIEEAALTEVSPELAAATPVVSRDTQRIGLIAGFVIYGLAIGLLFYAALFVLRNRLLPAMSIARQGVLLAAVAYWGIALVPFLKYPANPPGVGEPESIAFRQLTTLSLTVLLLIGSAVMLYIARRRGGAPWLGLAVVHVVYAGLLWVVFPVNPDPVHVPEELLIQFRIHSLTGMTLTWALLGATFAWFMRGHGSEATAMRQAHNGGL